MATIGVDCQVIIDGTGYYVEPGTYGVARPRVRSAAITRGLASGHLGVPERYYDRGPGKREWSFVVQCYNSLKRYDGSQMGNVGQALRDALHASYEKVGQTLGFTDPQGTVWNVYFDDLTEGVFDLREQAGPPATTGGAAGSSAAVGWLGYVAAVVLVEG